MEGQNNNNEQNGFGVGEREPQKSSNSFVSIIFSLVAIGLFITLIVVLLNGKVGGKSEDELIVKDGYLYVNGTKTEYKVNSENNIKDSVTVDSGGFLVVNGVKTEYKVDIGNHRFGEWELYNVGETNCEKKIYSRTCTECSASEWKKGEYTDHSFKTVTTPPSCYAGGYDTKSCYNCGKTEVCNQTLPIAHTYSEEYLVDADYHWKKCSVCSLSTLKEEHMLAGEVCGVCNIPVGSTNGIVYELSHDGTYAMVLTYSGSSTRVRIAEEYNGVPVKTIYSSAFKDNKNITQIIIPDSVVEIGGYAFSGCTSLVSISVGAGVVTIAERAFNACTALANVEIPSDVFQIGDSAFRDCTALKEITIPDSVTNLGAFAFSGCTSLERVTLGVRVSAIGEKTFYNCPKITSVTIPSSVISIGEYAFRSCTALSSVTLSLGLENIGAYAFSGCKKIESITVPDSVIAIGDRAFSNCERLASVDFGNCLANISSSAFADCSASLYAEYEQGKYVGSNEKPYAVLVEISNKNLSTYAIHDDTVIIATGVFTDCQRLTGIVIPRSVKYIGDWAFSFCNSLANVYYSGSEEEWKKITIGAINYPLEESTKHFGINPVLVDTDI